MRRPAAQWRQTLFLSVSLSLLLSTSSGLDAFPTGPVAPEDTLGALEAAQTPNCPSMDAEIDHRPRAPTYT